MTPDATAARAARTQPREPWHWRVRELVGAYLPLLLMALLALATLWLVRNTPAPDEPRAAPLLDGEPDYTMQRFLLQRFAPDGRLRVQIEGDQLRHYPGTRTIEIDGVRLRAVDDDGSLTLASARQALADDAGSEVQLRGGAELTHRPGNGGEPIEFRGEFLHAFVDAQRVRSHLPVTVTQGASRIDAAGVEVDQRARTVRIDGPLKAVIEPGLARR